MIFFAEFFPVYGFSSFSSLIRNLIGTYNVFSRNHSDFLDLLLFYPLFRMLLKEER